MNIITKLKNLMNSYNDLHNLVTNSLLNQNLNITSTTNLYFY